jgi:hypothetical protein
MPLFRPRTSIYEAVLFQGVVYKDEAKTHYDILFDLDGSDRLPTWLRDGLIDGDLTVDRGTSNLALGIDIDGDEVSVQPGDWLMYDLDTELPEDFAGIFVVSGNEMLEDFEPIPTPERQDAVVHVVGVEASGMNPFEGTPV